MLRRAKIDLSPREKINLIRECLRANANISILMNSLFLIEKGFIKTDTQLQNYLQRRVKRAPRYSKDVEIIKEILINTVF